MKVKVESVASSWWVGFGQGPQAEKPLPAPDCSHRCRALGRAGLRFDCARLEDFKLSIDGNELTDKGYINQRAALVARLHAEVSDDEVIVFD